MTSLKRSAFNTISKSIIGLLTLNRASKFKSAFNGFIQPSMKIKTGSRDLRFHCPNELIYWRLETLFEKEPETITWINDFNSGDVLYDIGANIGTFSLYAASRGHEVLAFEPEALNFAELWRNITLNDLNVHPYNVAIGDHEGYITLAPSGPEAGAAKHTTAYDVPKSRKLAQHIFSESLDSFIKKGGVPYPNHIKIDVDGFESEIVDGMSHTLSRPELKSILIEINENNVNDRAISEKLSRSGFEVSMKTNFSNNINNYIFKRRRT